MHDLILSCTEVSPTPEWNSCTKCSGKHTWIDANYAMEMLTMYMPYVNYFKNTLKKSNES